MATVHFKGFGEIEVPVGTTLLEILERRFPYVDEFINRIPK